MDQTTLTVRVQFAPGTLDAHTTLVDLVIDTDQNPFTGSPGVDSGGSDKGLNGADYIIDMGSDCEKGQATIRRATGRPNNFEATGSVPLTFPGGDMEATIPLSMLGNPKSAMNFKATASSQIGPCAYTGVLDYMPNLGLSPGRTTRR